MVFTDFFCTKTVNYVVLNCGFFYTILMFKNFLAALNSCLDDALEPLSMHGPLPNTRAH